MNRRTRIILLFFLPIQLVLAQQTIVIPMDISTQRPIIQVSVNGQGPYQFIFDTGSATNVIDMGLAEELGLKTVGEDKLRSQGPNQITSKRMEAESISIVGTDITQKGTLNAVALRSMLPIDGIIGNTFTEDYLVTLDYPASQLKLQKSELNASQAGVMSFMQKPRIINLHMTVAGKRVETHLDTGSPGGFSLPYAMKDQLKFKEPLRKGGTIRTPTASFQPWHGQLVGNIQIGNVTFENPDVTLVEGFEQANIGYQVIKDLAISIDRQNNLIRFVKPEAKAQVESSGDGTTNEFTGWYEGKREVYLEAGEMYLKRQDFVLKLEPIEGDLYKMTYHIQVRNELPNVRFDRDGSGKVTGLTFIFKNGREDKVKKN